MSGPHPPQQELTERLRELAERDVRLWREGDNLRFSAPRGRLTAADREWLQASKSRLLAVLGGAEAATPLARLERRSLLGLVCAGKLPRVDGAWIIYAPAELLEASAISREAFRDHLEGLPFLHSILETPLGRIGIVLMPRSSGDLGAHGELVSDVVDALALAASLGAKVASLAGVLSFLTDYGRDVLRAAEGRAGLPQVTTGHDTTAASVVMGCRDLAAAVGRPMEQETVGVLGLGSIGTSSLQLMLRELPHPKKVILCDLFQKREELARLGDRLRQELGFKGELRVELARPALPDGFFESTLIIGATNAPEVLDVARLRPGTLVVDDSYPPCFDVAAAAARATSSRDLLFTDGGLLQAPAPLQETVCFPGLLRGAAEAGLIPRSHRQTPTTLHSCTVASVMGRARVDLVPTTGLVTLEQCAAHYRALDAAGFKAADLQLGRFVIDPAVIADFRAAHGSARS